MTHDHVDGQGDLIRWAFFYDLLMKAVTFGREAAFREATLDAAKVKRGDYVLDIGCGTGTLALAARRRAGPDAKVHGIDPSDEMVARAKARAARMGLAVAFEVASAQKLPFPDGAFDVVLSSLMLHHLPEAVRKDAVREVRRVLKPSGRFMVVELIRKPGLLAAITPARFSHQHHHSHAFEDAKTALKDGGFREIGSGGFQTRFAAWVLGEATPNLN